ncbi:MAG: hypothetical protein WEB58_01595 [Planctomycetaceae bacterium]
MLFHSANRRFPRVFSCLVVALLTCGDLTALHAQETSATSESSTLLAQQERGPYRGRRYGYGRFNRGSRTAVLNLETPMAPPEWALLERELLRANSEACRVFYEKYFDERGYLLCVERWGANDGPDDAIECLQNWPILYALGGDDDVDAMTRQAWEGHLRQYTLAKTTEVPMARDGMYFREFPVMIDWLHLSEGLTVFSFLGLSEPDDNSWRARTKRYAGFYTGEDPTTPNYDPQHKIIRSMWTGSKGPLLRPATPLDWAGDPIDVEGRFNPLHGEKTFAQFLDHYRDYTDVVGDHPSNLLATSLALNAYMLDHEPKYKDWILEYVGAWNDRIAANQNIIPSKVGLDGKIGGESGKWYAGTYGWGFTVTVPQDGSKAHRNTVGIGFYGFANAYLLTGEDKYLDGWRRQIDDINSHAKSVEGQKMYPQMFGDRGWYAYSTSPYQIGALEIYSLTLDPKDKVRVTNRAWLDWLDGKNPNFPVESLKRDWERLRSQVAAMQSDATTPDTRLADDPMIFNPASVNSLVQLMWGGIPGTKNSMTMLAAVRYFDPGERRAGLPENVAALVEKIAPEGVIVSLVNLDPVESKTVIVQAGGYGEHQITSASIGNQTVNVNAPHVTVTLAPGAGGKVKILTNRFRNAPSLRMPWDR